MNALLQTYDRIAHDYAKDHEKDTWGYDLLDELIRSVNNTGTILDVGCGPGFECAYVVKSGRAVVGIDFSPEMIREATRRYPAISFRVADMTSLDFAPDSFDAVIARSSLHHVQKSQTPGVLLAIRRVLKKGGMIYVSVKKGSGTSVEKECDYGYKYKRFYAYFEEEELAQLLNDAGFAVEKVNIIHGANSQRLQFLARAI